MKRKIYFGVKLILIFYLLGHTSGLKASTKDSDQKQKHGQHETVNSNDLKMGERLYYGLIISDGRAINCASCHNTELIDTFNWNPSALDLAISTQHMDSASFANSLLNPVTKRISEVHKDISLSADQIVLIRKYVNTFAESGLKPHKMLITKLVFFIFLIILLLVAFIDLSFTKKIKFKAVHVFVILFALTFIFKIIVQDAIGLGRTKNYAPLQAIKFSHQIHATDNKIDCIYCHHTAETAKSAGIPSVNVCLNCHELVREGSYSGRFEIQKILTHAENKQAVEWTRIHKLPDHVFFSHAQHVGAGQVECKECHGLIEESHLASQYAELSMGWCLDCHRSRKVDFPDNEYYTKTFPEFQEQFKKNMIDSLTVAQVGGENCMKCHY